MSVVKKTSWLLVVTLFLSIAGVAFADNSYDRELIVTGNTNRSDQVEVVFKELMAAYEDEDAQGFLDLVSDDRFRQDYITFTDALYSDFRSYEIHHVDYWIDRVVPDHVKRFLYVRWEKRYEDLDDGRQLTSRGYSRFLFDDVDGDYLLVELAGNHLFGNSLQEWREEVIPISGQELIVNTDADDSPAAVCDQNHLELCNISNCTENGGFWYDNSCHREVGEMCDPQHLYLCDASNCQKDGQGYWYDGNCHGDEKPSCSLDNLNLCGESECSGLGLFWYDNACHVEQNEVCDPQHLYLCDSSSCQKDGHGYWYNNTCNSNPEIVCDPQHLYLCDSSNCQNDGHGYWYNNTCNSNPEVVCDPYHLNLCDGANCSSNGGYWYENSCHAEEQGQPDLVITSASQFYSSPMYNLQFTVTNQGALASDPCSLEAWPAFSAPAPDVYSIDGLNPGESRTYTKNEVSEMGSLEVDVYNGVPESNENNNFYNF